MHKLIITLLIAVLGVSCFSTVIIPAFAQTTTVPSDDTIAQPPLIVRWMRFRGVVTAWGSEPYHGTVTVNAKTANVPPILFKPWATVEAVWSNEQRPFATDTKPLGEVTYTHYVARLVFLQAIRGKQADPKYNLNVTGIWNVNEVKITSEFDEDGNVIKSIREVTPLVNRAKGQLHITDDWKKFDIEIQGIDAVIGNGIAMSTSTNIINPFSFNQESRPTLRDIVQMIRCYRAMPGFGNYLPELDYNLDSKIDLADLTTVAANM